MGINERLKAEQHQKLRELQAKLEDVLESEPADSEDDLENEIWEQANGLKDSLDEFFDEKEKVMKNVLCQLHNAGGCDASDEYSRGWDDAITEAIRIVEKESGIRIADVLD